MADENAPTLPWWQTMRTDPWWITASKAVLGEREVEQMRRGEPLAYINLAAPLLFMGRGPKGEIRLPTQEELLPPPTKALLDAVRQTPPVIASGDPFTPPMIVPSGPAAAAGRTHMFGKPRAYPFDVENLPTAPRPGEPPEPPPPIKRPASPYAYMPKPFDVEGMPTAPRPEPKIKITKEEALEAHNKFLEKLNDYIAGLGPKPEELGPKPTEKPPEISPGALEQWKQLKQKYGEGPMYASGTEPPAPASEAGPVPSEKLGKQQLSPYDESPAAELERILYWGNYRPGGKPYYPYSSQDVETFKQLGVPTPPRTAGETQGDWHDFLIKHAASGGNGHQEPGGLEFKKQFPDVWYKDFPYPPAPPQDFPARFMQPPAPSPPPAFDFSQFSYVIPQMPIRPTPDWYQQMRNAQTYPGQYAYAIV